MAFLNHWIIFRHMKLHVSKLNLWLGIFTISIVFLLYGKSIQHKYNIDDNYVVENHELVSLGIKGIPKIFTSRYHTERDQFFGYRPLTIAVYALETSIFGENTSIYHLFNLLYYAILILVLFKVIKKLIPDISKPFIFIALIIFLVHPIHTEVLLSLKNREEILCFLLASLSWLHFIRYVDHKRIISLISSILLLGLAFLTKETAVVFLILIPLSIFYFRGKLVQIDLRSILNFKQSQGWILLFQLLLLSLILHRPSSFNFTISVITVIFSIIGIIGLSYYFNKLHKLKLKITSIPILISTLFFLLSLLLLIFTSPKIALKSLTISMLIIIVYVHLNSYSFNSKQLLNKIQRIPRLYLILGGFVILSGIIISAIYLIPNLILPQENAPVYHWQNPLFTDNSISSKFSIALYSMGYYLKLLFVPSPLRFYYGYAIIPHVQPYNIVVILSLLAHLLLLIISFKTYRSKPLLSFSILIYFIGILPFSNIFFPLTGIVAERLLFIPSLGFSIAITYGLFILFKHNPIQSNRIKHLSGIIISSLIIILPYSVLTIQRVPDWESRESLYQADIPKLEQSAKANNLYGNYLISKVFNGMKQGVPLQKMDKTIHEAIQHFEQTIKIDSTYSNSYHNLGYIYMIIGRDYSTAKQYFTQCLNIDTLIPEAWMNRGVCNFHLEDYQAAKSDLNKSKAFNMEKEMDKIYYYLGQIELIQEDTVSTLKYYDSALYYKPNNIRIIQELQTLNAKQRKYQEAIKYVTRLIELSKTPNDKLWVDKGNYELLSGDTINAVKSWEEAFNIFPGNYNIGLTLSRYYAEKEEFEKSHYFKIKAKENKFLKLSE
jgi:tetratricopeptide (TPR) repeat protein